MSKILGRISVSHLRRKLQCSPTWSINLSSSRLTNTETMRTVGNYPVRGEEAILFLYRKRRSQARFRSGYEGKIHDGDVLLASLLLQTGRPSGTFSRNF